MIIHLETIIDIESGAILSDITEEYDGPVMLCGGGSTVEAPKKTATEEALDAEQLAMLREQRAFQKEFEPFMLESMGYVRNPETGQIEKSTVMTPEKILLKKNLLMAGYDENGNLLTEEQQLAGMTDAEKLYYQTNKLNMQRQMDALEGKLEISPQLEEELSTEEAQAQEVLARKLGKDWMLSTPGQDLMKTIKQKNALIREEARRGLITTTQGVADSKSSQNSLQESNRMALGGEFSSLNDNKYNQMMGFSKSKTMGMDDSLSLSSKYASDRAAIQNASAQTAANKAAVTSSQYAAGGAVAGAAAAAAAAAYSDERLKDIDGLCKYGLKEILDIDPINWTWKNNKELGIQSGFSAQRVRDVLPNAVLEDDAGLLMVNPMPIIAALVNAVKELNDKIKTMEA